MKAALAACERPKSFPWSTRLVTVISLIVLVDLLKHAALIAAGQLQPWGDSTVYWRMAGDVAAGDWWLTNHPVAYRTPGYPWLVGLIRSGAGEYALFSTVVLQHACVWLTTLLTVASTWRVSQSVRATILAWVVCAFSTARPLYANWLLTESLATLFCMLACWLFLLAYGCGCWKRLAFAGFVLGCGVLVRPALLAVVPAVVVLGMWIAARYSRAWFRRGLVGLAAPVILGLTLLPWCIRNSLLFDRFSLVVFTGRELWTASFSPWPGAHLPYPAGPEADELLAQLGRTEIDWRHHWSVSRVLARRGWNDAEIDLAMERVARQAIAERPLTAAVCMLARCGTFWYCWEWPTDLTREPADIEARRVYADQFRWHSPGWQARVIMFLKWSPERHRIASLVMVLLSWTGLVRLLLREQTRPAAVFIGLILVTTTLLTATLEIPLYRYRCGLEPLLIIAAAAGWAATKEDRSTTRLP